MRTKRPFLTCSFTSELGPSSASPESSTPRLTGPGCIRSWRGPKAAAVHLVLDGVLAERGDEALRHALLLHAQGVDDVRLVEAVDVVGDLAAERGGGVTRDERGRPAESDLGAHEAEGHGRGAGDATVEDVADDPDLLAVERVEAAAKRVDVQKRLAGVLVLAVARVDDGGVGPVR